MNQSTRDGNVNKVGPAFRNILIGFKHLTVQFAHLSESISAFRNYVRQVDVLRDLQPIVGTLPELTESYDRDSPFHFFSLQHTRLTGELPGSGFPRFFVKKKNTLTRLDLEQILFVEVAGRHCLISTKVGNFLIQKSLKELEEVFTKPNFLRVHRNYLLNFGAVEKILLDDYHIELADGHSVPFGQSFKASLLSQIEVLK